MFHGGLKRCYIHAPRTNRAALLLFPPSLQIEGWGDEASYFVVSDQSRVRVEALLLFHESQTSDKFGAGAASPRADGTAGRAFMSGSGVPGKGKGRRNGSEKDVTGGRNGDGPGEEGIVTRVRSWLDGVEQAGAECCVHAVLAFFGFFAVCFAVGFLYMGLAQVAEWRLW